MVLIAERNIRLYLGQPAEAPAPKVEVAIPAAARRAPCTFEASREGAFACVDFRFGPRARSLDRRRGLLGYAPVRRKTHEPGWFRAHPPEGFDSTQGSGRCA